jgi:hypothetical protein
MDNYHHKFFPELLLLLLTDRVGLYFVAKVHSSVVELRPVHITRARVTRYARE